MQYKWQDQEIGMRKSFSHKQSPEELEPSLSVDALLYSPMAPDSPAQGATSSAHTASSDNDSGCALEEYLDLKTHPSALRFTLSSSDTQELKFVQTLLHLLPPQDSDERFCTALGDLERRELQTFSAHRRLHSMRHGRIVLVTPDSPDSCCMRCGDKILVGDTAVHTERFQDERLCWHSRCFVCETCHLPLSQFIYFMQDRRIYCGRHHAELTRARCAACDQLILSERCTVAEGHHWHVEHFCCWECEMVLGGSRYVMKGARPFCRGCFQRLYAESCEACGEPVDPDGDLVTLKGQYWHSLPSCFCCFSCRAPLRMSEFMVHDDHLYCSQHCLPFDPQLHRTSSFQRSVQCNSHWGRSHLHCTSWRETETAWSSKRLNTSLHGSPVTRCQEGIPRLFSSTDLETADTWLPEHRQITEYEEDTSCSSSDSEPEGYFLGRPIPNYSLNRGTDSPVRGKSHSLKRRQMGKSCKVS
ncbi:prickle-like protein 4 isoform X1 [Pseudophryne corroboree]|uniref:prickle-like protein 4 isoform X1 n=1 Tax=Pseudophryne corroboree TaxID=495146 RepID=UPI003081E4E2